MITTYNGNRYSFEVESLHSETEIDFSVTAIDKASGHFSSINTLNQMLSEFGFDEDDPRSEESDWLLTKQEYPRFRKIAKDVFTERNYLKYLEDKLDEDRRIGEWANRRPS